MKYFYGSPSSSYLTKKIEIYVLYCPFYTFGENIVYLKSSATVWPLDYLNKSNIISETFEYVSGRKMSFFILISLIQCMGFKIYYMHIHVW